MQIDSHFGWHLQYALEESLNFLLLKVIVIWASVEMKPNLGLWSWLGW